MIEDTSRSLAERLFEKRHRAMTIQDTNLPPPDLAHSLISLYFSHIHPFTLVVHQENFLGLYGSGLIHRDLTFKGLCYAMFAAASPYSNDERVLCSLTDQPANPQTAGARYAAAAVTTISPVTLPCTLFDLQAMAILSHYYLAMCTPTSAWLVIGSWLRRVQDVGVHVEEMPRWRTSILKDQLRKRAFWYMVVSERLLCMSLGRTSTILELQLTVQLPLFIRDEVLTKMHSEHPGKVTSKDQERYKNMSWELSGDTYLACATAYWSLRTSISAHFHKIWSTRPDKVVPRSAAEMWGSPKLMLLDLAAKVDHYIEHEMPSVARWDPEAKDDKSLIWTAFLNSFVLNIKLLAHRNLLNDAPHEVEVCTAAARSNLDILDQLHKRGLLLLTAHWAPYRILPAALICLYAACRRESEIPRAEKLTAWADVHRCINLLSGLAPKFFLAQQLQDSLSRLVNLRIEEIRSILSEEANASDKNRRSEVAEPLPSEGLLNMFASNQQLPTHQRTAKPCGAPVTNPHSTNHSSTSIPSESHHNLTKQTTSIEGFEEILEHLLSLPNGALYNQTDPNNNVPPTECRAGTGSDADLTSPTSPHITRECDEMYLNPSGQLNAASYLSYSGFDIHTSNPTNFSQAWYEPSAGGSYPIQGRGASAGFNENFVPPLPIDASFFHLDLAPSFTPVDLTPLLGSSTSMLDTSVFQNYVQTPQVSQSSIPASTAQTTSTFPWHESSFSNQ
ncbi:fungal-specific transcription factor domain-containing protein [Melampsora americana]|nr:fungal-specific transcription factor domain-containing protein [Melampsora americana]